MDELYYIHELLCKSADKEYQYAAKDLEQAVVSFQKAMTLPEKEAPDGDD
jgi:hypothetical protein